MPSSAPGVRIGGQRNTIVGNVYTTDEDAARGIRVTGATGNVVCVGNHLEHRAAA